MKVRLIKNTILVIILNLFVNCIVDAYDDFEFVMPTVTNNDWKPIPLSKLECPITGKLRRPNWEEKITRKGARLDGAIESAMHQGFLCHSVIYKSICETNFFRVKYTTYKIEQKRAYEEDCLAEYVKEQQGVRVTNHFPPFKCQWMSIQEESLTEISITAHPVRFDIYRNSFVDGLFVGGICSESPCSESPCVTNTDSVIWLKSGKKSLVCWLQFRAL